MNVRGDLIYIVILFFVDYVCATEAPFTSACPPHEEYRLCEPCGRTCAAPNPVCPAQCARGCFCRDGLLRHRSGRCVRPDKCDGTVTPPVAPSSLQVCGALEEFQQCGGCEARCGAAGRTCAVGCGGGCYCRRGLVRSDDGHCVPWKRCPRAELQRSLSFTYDASVEDCGSREMFLSCGWCEPSCRRPRGACPAHACTRGCLCRPPLVRHKSGNCVELNDCEPKTCKQNESYTCRLGCEPSCSGRECLFKLSRCVLGCHCRRGYLRNAAGSCVKESDCHRKPQKPDVTILKEPIFKVSLLLAGPYTPCFRRHCKLADM